METLFTIYCSPFTIHHSPFTIHPFAIHHSQCGLRFKR